jgi:hypothetical protein
MPIGERPSESASQPDHVLNEQKRAREAELHSDKQAKRPARRLTEKAYQQLDGSWENEIGEVIKQPGPAREHGPFVRTGLRQNAAGQYMDQFGNPTIPTVEELKLLQERAEFPESER